jgi:hypothetical protein
MPIDIEVSTYDTRLHLADVDFILTTDSLYRRTMHLIFCFCFVCRMIRRSITTSFLASWISQVAQS